MKEMKIALFRCCITSMGLSQYETSSNAVLSALGMEFVDIKEFNCCGYPLRNSNVNAYLLSAARNFALAERAGMDILTVCNCCYGSLKHAEHILRHSPSMMGEINSSLATQGLMYSGKATIKHFLGVLHDEFGVETLRKRLKKTLDGLKVAVHYGCHLLRPAEVMQFEGKFPPVKFDSLVEAIGAVSVPWTRQFDCCGSPLLGVNDKLSADLTEKKLKSAREGGAECLTVTCPYCQMQFSKIRKRMEETRDFKMSVPSVLFPQLLGLCLGIDRKALGIEEDLPDAVNNHLREIVSEPRLADARAA